MGTADDDDDARHRREEQERRAKRKASKMSKSAAQREIERKRAEHRQKILKQQQGGKHKPSPPPKRGGAGAGAGGGNKPPTSSAFQELFQQRAQGFSIDFRFRNAPPRPPVGPTFCGETLERVLQEAAATYNKKALFVNNTVEVQYTWKLHHESDLGVPLAPSAMDLASYDKAAAAAAANAAADDDDYSAGHLHPDDIALLDWKGSEGDTAAERRKLRLDRAKAAARFAAAGGTGSAPLAPQLPAQPQKFSTKTMTNKNKANSNKQQSKKAFSRVLKEDMQTWMKKTTYLSNDYSRKVHDFKSLAQTKQELAQDLNTKQEAIDKRRSAKAIQEQFVPSDNNNKSKQQHAQHVLRHPAKKHLKPKKVYPLLPNVSHWGQAFTHVVIDKAPALKPDEMSKLNRGLIAGVQQHAASARMTCQLWIPMDDDKSEENNSNKEEGDDNDDGDDKKDKDKKKNRYPYHPAHAFDLDVIPLKEEDAPHQHFCIWTDDDTNTATYIPISSRVQLSMGRPVRRAAPQRTVQRRSITDEEVQEMEMATAAVDIDLAQKHDVLQQQQPKKRSSSSAEGGAGATTKADDDDDDNKKRDDDGDDMDDFGDDDDDDDDDEEMFGGGAKTIVAD